MPKPRTAAVRLDTIAIHEDVPEDFDQTMASDPEDTEQGSASAGESVSQDGRSSREYAEEEPEEELEEEVEQSVAEDMSRFLNSFEGLKDKYRLINRIGEGEEHSTRMICKQKTNSSLQEPSRQSTKHKTCNTMSMIMIGTYKAIKIHHIGNISMQNMVEATAARMSPNMLP